MTTVARITQHLFITLVCKHLPYNCILSEHAIQLYGLCLHMSELLNKHNYLRALQLHCGHIHSLLSSGFSSLIPQMRGMTNGIKDIIY